MATHPIWRKYVVLLGTADSVEFSISRKVNTGGTLEEIYRGVAHRKPNMGAIWVQINDICADFMTPKSFDDESYPNLYPYEFVIQTISSTGQYTQKDRVQFVNDWSYEDNTAITNKVLSYPINGRVDSRQYLFFTLLNSPYTKRSKSYADASVKTQTLFSSDAIFSSDFDEIANLAKVTQRAGSGTIIDSCRTESKAVKSITLYNPSGTEYLTYDVVQSCARYCLYYLNAFGGWDSFLIEGNHARTDDITHSTIDIGEEKSTTMPDTREVVNYRNAIKERYTLHTSWLSDDESSRMHHLLNSTDIYMHDLETDKVVPVLIESSSTPYKSYKGEGGNLVRYDIDVVVAQKRERR